MEKRDSLIIAVDSGGSGSRVALATRKGELLATAEGGFANITTDFNTSRRNVLAAIEAAYGRAGLDHRRMREDAAYLGLASANIGDCARILEKCLGFRAVNVVSDREIAVHGALGASDGVVAMIGTGSTLAVQKQGAAHRGGGLRFVGGWGFALGDDGSGAALGCQLWRQSLPAHDGLLPTSSLSDQILGHFGGPGAMVTFARTAGPGDYAAFVPDLLEHYRQGDPIAARIMNAATQEVAGILDALDVPVIGRLCWLGCLGSTYRQLLADCFTAFAINPKGNSLDGAIGVCYGSVHNSTVRNISN